MPKCFVQSMRLYFLLQIFVLALKDVPSKFSACLFFWSMVRHLNHVHRGDAFRCKGSKICSDIGDKFFGSDPNYHNLNSFQHRNKTNCRSLACVLFHSHPSTRVALQIERKQIFVPMSLLQNKSFQSLEEFGKAITFLGLHACNRWKSVFLSKLFKFCNFHLLDQPL